jgi:hypothetical protein
VNTSGEREEHILLNSINWGYKQRWMLRAPTPLIVLREKLRHDVSYLIDIRTFLSLMQGPFSLLPGRTYTVVRGEH